MEYLFNGLKKKYEGLRYSNLVKNRKNEWWFTIEPQSFRNKTLYLMLIHKFFKEAYIVKVNTAKQLSDIVPRKDGVHLSGHYDLYFFLDGNTLNIRYPTSKGMKIEIFSNIVEKIKASDFPFIQDDSELKVNILTLESYLDLEYSEIEEEFAKSLIQKGKNFVAYKVNGEIHFAPSRFLDYKDNNMIKYLENNNKDIKETTPVINYISQYKVSANSDLENEYIEYCKSLGIKTHHKNRKYWLIDFTETDFEKNINTKAYKEGRLLYIQHKKRERNPQLVKDAKRKFRQEHGGKLYCELCNFNFLDYYGIDYIEVHHLKAMHLMEDNEETSLEDVKLVCANCHRVIHSEEPQLNIETVIEKIKKKLQKN